MAENGHVDGAAFSKQRRMSTKSIDRDAQEMVIESLRSQVQDLFSQVSQLNNKLVKSYDRVSDLEDDLHVAAANVRTSSLKISQLELERTQHLSALNTGLLVEKSHVTAELNRLMEKATEEAAQRGQAESARMAIEKDLDDLSATLFGQANSMVAEARFDKHLSERKVEEAETALKTAEEAVQVMQAQMQAMLAEREEAEKKTREMELLMGKGKWVQREDSGFALPPLRLLSTHSPYSEYQAFVAHLRVLHPSAPTPPAMSTLLPLPFLARLLTEDTEPTVRLDLAPSLNWLSRRSVLTAIYSGQLTIEPVSAATLFTEAMNQPSTTVAGMNSTHDNISCALCGLALFGTSNQVATPTRPSLASLGQGSWSAGSFFKKTNSTGSANGVSSSAASIRSSSADALNAQVFIFRLASPPSTSIPSLPISSLPIPSLTKSSSQSNGPIPSYSNASTSYANGPLHSQSASPSNQPSTIYPLCMTGWCLNRLRATCTLWAFVRTGIVDKVWEEELPPPPPPPSIPVTSNDTPKPPVPPRKRGLWGIASALGERAASWSGDDAKEKMAKSASATPTPAATPPTATNGSLPGPPPQHPPLNTPTPRRLPPPLPPASSLAKNADLPPTPPLAAGTPTPPAGGAPPPLPRRSEGRTRTATATPEPGQGPPPPLPARSRGDHVTDAVAPLATPTKDAPPEVLFEHTDDHTAEDVPSSEPVSAPSPVSSPPPPARVASPTPTSPQLHAGGIPTPPPRRSIDVPALPARSAKRNSHIRTHSATSINLGRPSTPSSVPLPESRPGTPGIPSRATSPAIVLHAAGPGGAAPPPIPRRAAARTRVISVADAPETPAESEAVAEAQASTQPSAAGEDDSKPAVEAESTPVVVESESKPEVEAPAAVAQEQVQETVAPVADSDAPKPDTVLPDIGATDVPASADQETPARDSAPEPPSGQSELEKVVPVPTADVSVDHAGTTTTVPDASSADAETHLAARTTESQKTEEQQAASQTPEINGGVSTPVNGDAEKEIIAQDAVKVNGEHTEDPASAHSEDGDVKAEPLAAENPVVAEQVASDSGELEKQKQQEEEEERERLAREKEEKYKVGYVGDASWEEKAWREIVRLREDLFWARIGGFRD